jgi:arylformamidase
MRIVDLTFDLTDGMPVYPTDPSVKIARFATIDTSGVNLTRIEMGSHSGTHIDAPLHYLPHGKAVDQLSLSKCYGKAVLLTIPKKRRETIDVKDLQKFEGALQQERKVIVKTGWFKMWGDKEYFEDFPVLTKTGASWLLEKGIHLYGSDTPAAVDAEGHRILLEKEVVLVEALNLAALETPKFTLIALPLKLNLSDGSPVRALAVVET